MATYCPDASVVLAFLLEEGLPQVDQFFLNIRASDELIGARLLIPECTANIRRAVNQHRIERDHGARLVGRLIRMPVRISTNLAQFTRAYELAVSLGLVKAYDAQYVATAEVEGIELVTVDGGMRDVANRIGIPVRFLR